MQGKRPAHAPLGSQWAALVPSDWPWALYHRVTQLKTKQQKEGSQLSLIYKLDVSSSMKSAS